MGYDLNITAKNAGKTLPIARLSDTGLEGDDYSKALRMIEAGMSFTYRSGSLNIIIKAA